MHREYVETAESRVCNAMTSGWRDLLARASTMGNKPLGHFHCPRVVLCELPRELSVSTADSSRCENFLFRYIRAITSDFASQHWVMNAADVASVLFASIARMLRLLYLFVYHDYITPRAIRLENCTALSCQ